MSRITPLLNERTLLRKHLLYVVKVAMEDADAAADSEGNDDAS
jgi:hypothetical protein